MFNEMGIDEELRFRLSLLRLLTEPHSRTLPAGDANTKLVELAELIPVSRVAR